MTRRLHAAAAGAAAAGLWALEEPLDRRVFRCEYSDVRLVGLPLHLANGAVFGVAYDEVRRHFGVSAVALALAEHIALWPLLGFWKPEIARSPRAFAQGAWRHVLFGYALSLFAP